MYRSVRHVRLMFFTKTSNEADVDIMFSSLLRDVQYIYRLPMVRMVKTDFLLENLWATGASLGKLEKVQCNSAVPIIIVQYYFCVKCIGHLCRLQNIFSNRP